MKGASWLIERRFTSRGLALAITFSALYAVLGFAKISPIIGLPGQAITAAAIIAPVIGILLGPAIGTLCTLLGGTVGFFLGALSYPSFAAGISTALLAGLIRGGKRAIGIVAYLGMFVLFAFYPNVGPAWLFPIETWFQLIGLVILVSPLQSIARKSLDSENNSRIMLGFFLVCLPSTLAGQIAGSTVFESLVADPQTLMGYWQTLTILYPIERTIIALASTIIGVSLSKAARLPSL